MKKPTNKRVKQVKPELPGGFRDALPEDAIAKEQLIEKAKTVFERFGFDPMQTSALERTDVLVGGEAGSDKIIFRAVPAVRGEVKDLKRDETSLRFDLTVPLARVLAAHTEIPKPFKRYQIAKVWRGERQQAGRYREFIQADIDIVGVKSLDADAEILQVMYETMKALGIENFKIRINNKEEVARLLDEVGIPAGKKNATLIAIDKKDKLSPREWEREVAKASGLSGEKLNQYLWRLSGENMLETTSVRELREKVEVLGVPRKYLIYDASLVRGLGYYTGSIFETALTDLPDFGSVFSGGRFDGLTRRFSTQAFPAVGASLGVDRLYDALEKTGKLERKQTLTRVLILNLGNEFQKDYTAIAARLRGAGVNTALYLGDDRAFQNQLAYAVKKEIPYVVIYGSREKEKNVVTVKNLATREQKEVPREKIIELLK